MLHLDFVARFVSDNNVVGDPFWVETLRDPDKQMSAMLPNPLAAEKEMLPQEKVSRCQGNCF